MLNCRSIGFRVVSVFSCLLIATPMVANGTYAASFEAGAAVGWAGAFLSRIQGVQAAPHHTDVPRPVFLGSNPLRGQDTRGGMWSEARLAALGAYEIETQLRHGITPPLAVAAVSAMSSPFAFGGSTEPILPLAMYRAGSSANAGSPFSWERDLGVISSATGNRLTPIHIVDWPIRGGGSVSLTLYHNSMTNISTAFGHSWRNSYDVQVRPVIDPIQEIETGADLHWGDGTIVPYTLSGGNYVAPAGIFDTLVKNGNGTYTITRKDQTKWECNTSGWATAWKDRAGNTVSITRSGSDITSISDPAGRSITFSYTNGKVTSITDPMSRVWTLAYGSSIDSITYPALGGQTYTRSFGYTDGRYNINTHTDLRGKTWTYAFNGDDQCTSASSPLNHASTYSYTSSATTITWPGGQTSTDNYSSGRIASRVDQSSFSDSFTSYNSANLPLSKTDKRGKTWTMSWDARGNLLTTTNPLGKTWTMTYSSQNDLLTLKDHLNNQTTYTYHSGSGKVLTVTDPLSRVNETNTFDANGQQLTTKNAMNEQYSFGYSTNGDCNSITDPTNKTWTKAFNTLGRQTSVTNPLNKTTSTSYDNWMRATTVTFPGGATKQSSYDRADNVTSVTDELSRTTSMVYDHSGRLVSVTNPKNEVESYGWNSNSWRTSVTNGRNYARTYTFTARGEVASLTMPGSSVEQWSYNAIGAVSAYTNQLSQVINYSYDDASRQTGIDYPTGTDITISYDDADRRTSMVDSTGTTTWTFNAGSEVTQLVQPNGTISYTYQASGRRATMVETGVGTTTYGWDAAGRPTSIQNPFSETTSITYDGAGRESRRTFHSGVYEDRTYDDRDRLIGVTLKNSSHTTLRTQTYGFDSASNVTSHTVDGVTTTYGYDNADQLTSESRTGYSASYSYDANGNRTNRTVNGLSETYTNDSGDKLTSVTWTGGSKTYGYDAAGRTTSVVTSAGTTTLSYDFENRITQITSPNSSTNTFQYNGLSARTRKVDASGTSNYKRDGVNPTSSVLNDSFANYTGPLSERRSGVTTYQHSALKSKDSQTGTSQSIVASRTYDAFGGIVATTGTWSGPFGYGGTRGYFEDAASGLALLGKRYYDASTGRFLTRDTRHSGRNWYVYCDNNPLARSDADGEDWDDLANFFGGWGNGLTFGLTGVLSNQVSNLFGYEDYDYDEGSGAFKAGKIIGEIHQSFIPVAGIARKVGKLVSIGDKATPPSGLGAVIGGGATRVREFAERHGIPHFIPWIKWDPAKGQCPGWISAITYAQDAMWIFVKAVSGADVGDLGIDPTKPGQYTFYRMEKAVWNFVKG